MHPDAGKLSITGKLITYSVFKVFNEYFELVSKHVMPAKAGIHEYGTVPLVEMDSRLRENDGD